MFRGNPEIFSPTCQVLGALVSGAGAGSALSPSQELELGGIKKKVEGIAQIMKQKLRLEKKYIDHMENKKGSDVLAKESAKKVLRVSRDLQSLYGILNSISAAKGEDHEFLCVSAEPKCAKNTIVRKAFMESTNLVSLRRS